jgi:hypothetical protein
MTQGTLKTQGTELFGIDTLTTTDPTIFKMACPTGISGLGGAADQLDDTCLDSTERTFKRGLGNPGQVTVPFNFIPSHLSHQLLEALKEDGRNLRWMIAFSDGTAIPTVAVDSDGAGAFEAPASPLRTTAEFEAYIADLNIDVATNEIVRGTLTLQRSGVVTWHYNGPTPV